MIKRWIKELVFRLRGESTIESLREKGLQTGKNFCALKGVILDPAHCWLIHIGDDVTLAPNVHVLAHDASTVHYLGYAKIGRVNIGNRVFIGTESVILPGVNIGDDVIVGANSTVTHDLPSGGVYAGSPARQIGSTEDFIAKNRKMMDKCPVYGEEYTVRANVSNEKKKQMLEELKNSFGYVK